MKASLSSLRASQAYRVLSQRDPPRGWTNAPKSDCTKVRITGGIGDLIVGLGAAEALDQKVGDVRVYSKWPEIAAMFSTLPQDFDENLMKEGTDWMVHLNAFAFFKFESNFKGFKNSKLNEVLVAHREWVGSGEWRHIIDAHPNLDNLAATKAVKLGLNRETLAYKSLGLEFTSPPRKTIFTKPMLCSLAVRGPYITVHDGFDANNSKVKTRAMKTWDLQHWRVLITMIRREFPGVKIVQLGGPTSRRIKGVDIDYVGLLSFAQSMEILSASHCHIDGDSGLVHAAHVFKVKSVVLFGPTNAGFFGYPENKNIESPFCGDCWWLNTDWMSRCALDFEKPECMDSIEPDMVMEKFREVFVVDL